MQRTMYFYSRKPRCWWHYWLKKRNAKTKSLQELFNKPGSASCEFWTPPSCNYFVTMQKLFVSTWMNSDRWTKHVSSNFRVAWSLDFFAWSIIKSSVYKTNVRDLLYLFTRIVTVVTKIIPFMIQMNFPL